ncbi:MAG TPA: rod shape-determining protein MreC [Acidimicrobiales bacterium]|nr:rod shape-determining protein MreC [Acidimicrobiales bacterium]
MATARRNTSQRLTLVILILASITAITLDYRGPASQALTSVRNGARDAVAPVQRVLSDVFRPVGDFFAGAVNYGAVQADNTELRSELGNLRRLALENQNAEQQLQQLLTVLKLPFLQNSTDVVADVISGPSSNFELTFEIDRGTADGVGSGMPVVAGAGLVGTVVSSGRSTSVVRLITDPRSRVGVRLPDGTIAVADGQGLGNPLTLSEVPASASVPHKGQLVVTSGLQGAAFPAGIPVGTVSSVKDRGGSLTQQITMKPVAQLAGLQYVAVVQWLPAA